MNSILLIDKPKGITSFDCIRILRRKLGVKKMGHAGTLDPMATGLMIIGVGEGTKKLQEFLKLDKTYEAEILLGLKTDTGDVTGAVIEKMGTISQATCEMVPIQQILKSMVGKLELPVPAYSAIKRGGEALYKKARRGEVVDTPIKTMEVKSAELLGVGILPFPKGEKRILGASQDLEYPSSDAKGVQLRYEGPHSDEGRDFLPSFSKEGIEGWLVSARFSVSSGTYIRSLAEEFGRRLGVPATLAGLRRTRIGDFKIEDAEAI